MKGGSMARVIDDTGNTHIIHEHHDGDSGTGMGVIIAVVILAVLAFLFLYYGLPAIRSASSPQVNVPGQVDVNVSRE